MRNSPFLKKTPKKVADTLTLNCDLHVNLFFPGSNEMSEKKKEKNLPWEPAPAPVGR